MQVSRQVYLSADANLLRTPQSDRHDGIRHIILKFYTCMGKTLPVFYTVIANM